jgi:DNA-binding MurR/RpiR family transcriptional regulator
MTTRLTLAIQEHLDQLSPSERKLATLLLDRADDLLTYSATELAAMAEVSKATAARLFRSLGYADFNEVRLQAREERDLSAPFAKAPAAAPARQRTIAHHLHHEIDSLSRTFESLRSDTLQTAVHHLARAPRVWLLGLGLDEGLARHVRPQLARIRPDVHCLGTQSGAWAEDLAMSAPRDALLLVMTQARSPWMDRLVSHAATTRVDIVSVVDVRHSAWARRISRAVLPCYGGHGMAGASAMAAASMLHLLVDAVADNIGKRAAQRQQMVADLRQELEGD